MLSNFPLYCWTMEVAAPAYKGILNMKLAETIDMVLSDLMNFDKDSSVCSPCLCVRVSTPILVACDQNSAQWNCSSCSRVMAYESCHSVWGLISIGTQESSPSVQDSLRTILPDGNMAYMSVYSYMYFACVLCSVQPLVLTWAFRWNFELLY